MRSASIKLGAIAVAGLLAPLWWTWTVSQLTYAIYLASGSPERPTRFLMWASIHAPSFILGLVTGVIVAILSAPAPLNGWLAFFVSLVLGTIALGVYFGAPAEHLAATFSSPGNGLFLVGTLLWPAIAHARITIGAHREREFPR